MLEVEARYAFPDFKLDVSFSAKGGITVLFGASGSGKSTVANLVAGLLRPDQGRVQINDHVVFDRARNIWVPPHRRRIGYVFQDARLFPHLTVAANLKFGRWFAPDRSDASEFNRIVDLLGLGRLLERRPIYLSGGEKQRVAIGRAFLSRPKLIVADEPLAALDHARKLEILPYFEQLRDELDIPILYVSHAASEVARLATTVVALSNGQVLRHGAPATVLGDPSVLPFGPRGAGSVLDTVVMAQHADGLSELAAGGQTLLVPQVPHAVGTKVRVRLSAHDVILARKRPEGISALNILVGTVSDVHNGIGPGAMIAVDSSAGSFLARVTQRSVSLLGLEPGVKVFGIIKSVAIAPNDIS